MNNIEPSIWGPYYWNTLHFMAAAYDEKPNHSVRSAMKTFIQSLPLFLPCKECQDNALSFIKTKDLDTVVSTRKELFHFFFDFHNRVNARLKKPLMKLEDAFKRYHVLPLLPQKKEESSSNAKLAALFLVALTLLALWSYVRAVHRW